MKINFYNNYRNGDVHFSRGIIKLIKKYYPNCEYYYYHHNKKGILKDLTFIEERDLASDSGKCYENWTVKTYDDAIYINTWYGQDHFKFLKNNGTTLRTISEITKHILLNLNLDVNFDDEELYPTIDFNNIKLPKLENGFKILICNNESTSGQSCNTNLNKMIEFFYKTYPEVILYVTKKIDFFGKNVIYVDDITNTYPNLVDISYISTKCDIIVGRCSGPYSFSILHENIKNVNKTFVALCADYTTGIWDERFFKCKYHHYYENNIDGIIELMVNIMKSYGK